MPGSPRHSKPSAVTTEPFIEFGPIRHHRHVNRHEDLAKPLQALSVNESPFSAKGDRIERARREQAAAVRQLSFSPS
jgi:hypothetical protein